MRNFTLSMLVLIVSVFFLTSSAFSQSILLVDRDGSAWAPGDYTDCSGYFMDALDANGYDFTYYEVMDGADDGPDAATMMEYDIVIWFTGEGWSGGETTTPNDETNLGAFLDNGGGLFFSGQDYLWDRYPSAGNFSAGEFPYDYLGLRSASQDTWVIADPDVLAVTGHGLADGMTFEFHDIFTTDKENLYVDQITDHAGMDLFEVTSPLPVGICGVQYEMRGFKSVFTTADFAAITEATAQADLMEAIVDYLGGGGGGGMECEDFDDLTAGDYVAGQLGGYWTTWGGNPGGADDAFVSDAQSHSPSNSFVIDDAAMDVVFQLGDAAITSGMWMYSHYMYIPTGNSGYFNVQSDPTPGIDWNLELYFSDGGTGEFGGQSTELFTFDQDVWFMVEIMYDLDAGMGYVYFDGTMVLEFANTLSIGGIDYWGWTDGGAPGAFYDDVCFGEYMPGDGCEDFDALTAGDYVAGQLGGYWTTWGGNPGGADDAFVSDAQSHSPSNSFVVDGGNVDLIFQFGDEAIASGQWLYSHYMYVPAGFSGYFNVQSDPTPGIDWNVEIYFDDGGTGSYGGQASGDFTYTQDTWFWVGINYDLDAGLAEIWFDDEVVLQFENTLTIGSIDYYGADSGGEPGAYYDDVCFGEGYEISAADCEDFDALTAGGYVAGQLGGYWTTWGGNPGGADDAFVSDMYSNSPDNSFVVDGGNVDLIFQFGDEALTTGQYMYTHYMYVPTGYSGYFNVQSDPTPGIDWNVELYFDDGGTGSFGGQASGDFTYMQDTWFMVSINYDLEHGFAEVWFDDEMILQFENTLSIGSIDYYGADSGGEPGAYYDDVCLGPGYVITGIEEKFIDNTTVIFPNPAREQITIQSQNIIDEVRIYNNMGQLVYSGQFNNGQIMVNTSNFITGMYIVQVRSGEAIEVRKLIVE